jgi:hypothetical protein
MCFSSLFAQVGAEVSDEYVYSQKVTPEGIDNYLFVMYYYHEKETYNLRNIQASADPGPIVSLKINPSGTSFLTLSQKKKEMQVALYDLWEANSNLHVFKEGKIATAIGYTPDARRILIATPTELLFFDARLYKPLDRMEMPFAASQLVVSGNGYYLAAASENRLTVWNLEQKSIRKEFEFDTKVNDMIFSADNSTFAILTEDGLLATYDTSNFLIQQSFDGMGEAISCSFHPDGKYISVATGDSRIVILNLLDDQDRTYVDNTQGGITDIRFVRDGKRQIYLVYNTAGSITYKLMSTLAPNYTRLLADELNERMNDWMKMMPGETLDEYNLRVNDETRIKQMQLFEQEISTRMADNLIEMSEVALGNYALESNMLAVNFSTIPTIYLNVPVDEVGDFTNPNDLEFRNVKYGLTRQDKFELIYADIYNKVSGKTYVFDNLNRQPLDFLRSDENFMSLELIQRSNMEEMRLQEIKEEVVDLAKQQQIISEHTQIRVNADIVSEQDANGKQIRNYQIDFAYEVEDGFSAQEDFAPGKYKNEDSGAAQSMLTIIKTALEGDFAQYVQSGKKVRVSITGMADALPINGRIAYDGSYGEFINEPVYKNDDLGTVTVTRREGITQNEQLAFLRATGVKEYITKNIPALSQMDIDYRNNIEVTTGEGGEYRRITVEFTFVDAF